MQRLRLGPFSPDVRVMMFHHYSLILLAYTCMCSENDIILAMLTANEKWIEINKVSVVFFGKYTVSRIARIFFRLLSLRSWRKILI